MRIALISDHASPLAAAGGVDSGGQNVYVAQLACHLARLGHLVDVFTRRDDATLPEVLEWKPSVRVVHVPAGPATWLRKEDLLPVMDEFAAWVRSFAERQAARYDVAHANFFMSGLAAIALKRALGVPYVVTFHALGRVRRVHQGDADQFPAQRLTIEDDTIAEAAAVIAECPQDKLDLTTLYRADPDRVSVVPCGFDKSEFWPIQRPFARRALGLAPDRRYLLCVGRMVPRKGLDNVVRGLARLRARADLAPTLIIVGGSSDIPDPAITPEIGRLRRVAEEEGVDTQVVFTGRRSREFLKLYYSAADMFVTTPWYEPFGITPLEAMACGTPVIGSDVGGIRYSVLDGTTGALVPPNDPDALADTIASLYGDPVRLREFGRNAIHRVRSQFTWARIARAIERLYADVGVVAAPRRRAARLAVAA